MKDRYLFKAKSFDFENFGWKIGLLEERHRYEFLIKYIEIDEDTICQCTGLKDDDGNLIFEGDLLFNEKTLRYGVPVIYKQGSFGVILEGIFSPLSDFCDKTKDEIFCFKIIGNIHDKER